MSRQYQIMIRRDTRYVISAENIEEAQEIALGEEWDNISESDIDNEKMIAEESYEILTNEDTTP